MIQGVGPGVVKERLSGRRTIEYKEEANGVIAPGRGRGSQVLRVLCNTQRGGPISCDTALVLARISSLSAS